VLFYVLFVCECVLYYCHRMSTQLQLTYFNIKMLFPNHRLPNIVNVSTFFNIHLIKIKERKEEGRPILRAMGRVEFNLLPDGVPNFIPIMQVYMQVLTVIFRTGTSYLRPSDRAGLIYRMWELETLNNVEK